MSILVIIVHVVVCVALIMIVLLQTGKGSDIGAAFGAGSSQTLFGATGASTFLNKMTTIAAAVFMVTSLGLAYFSSHRSANSIMTDVDPAPAQQTPQAPEVPMPLAPGQQEGVITTPGPESAQSTPLQQEGVVTIPKPGEPLQQEGVITAPEQAAPAKADVAEPAAPRPAAQSKPARQSKGDS